MSTVSEKAHRQDETDRGATLILVTVTMVGLLLIAALVLDMGGVYSERRSDQNAADAGALAAAFALPDRAAAASTAKTYVHDNLGVTFTPGQWNSCATKAVPDGYTKVTGSDCIAFNGSARRAFVRIPVQQFDTGFGQVVGVTELSHSAFAIAGLTPLGFGGIIPFGLVGQSSSFLCADSGGGNTGFCKSSGSGVTPGNFGVLDLAFWGDDIAGTTTSCSTTGQGPTDRIPNNVAVGVDHDLEEHPAPDPNPGAEAARKLDTGGPGAFTCPGQSASNAAQTITGENVGDEVGFGLWSGAGFSDGGDARLQRLGTLPNTPAWMEESGRTRSVGGHALDNIPLWEFIPTSFGTEGDVPRSCWRDQFVGPDGTFNTTDDRNNLPGGVKTAVAALSPGDRVVVLMDRCFVHYGTEGNGTTWAGVPANGVVVTPEPPCLAYTTPGDGTYSSCTVAADQFTDPVFARNTAVEAPLDLYDIQYTPRFAFVPKTSEPNGNKPRDFITFFTIYLQRIMAGCSAGGGCGLDFDPGLGTSAVSVPANVHGGLDALAVFVFPHSNILPNGLAREDAAFRDNANRTRSLVR